MPLNVPKNYSYVPSRSGPARIVTRSARRSRLEAGGTFFRSVRRGQDANLIFLSIIETPGTLNKRGAFVVHDRRFDPLAQVTQGVGAELFSCKLNWDQRIVLTSTGTSFAAELQGISWQIGGAVPPSSSIGAVPVGRLFNHPLFSIKISTTLPIGTTIIITPVIRIYQLSLITVDLPDAGGGFGGGEVTGWNITDLRQQLDDDPTAIVTMPVRAGNTPGSPLPGSDFQDEGEDALVASEFEFEPMQGGDGLPVSPAGLDTGPDRTLIHLNYAELDSGKMGVLNHIYEWVGTSASVGSWQRYS